MAAEAAPDIRTVQTPHGTVRVRDTGGEGTPILLIHSLLVDGDLYREVVPRLVASGHRCLVPEQPLGAHAIPLEPDADLTPPGLARLLVEVLDALEVERVHVVGVDTGGALTQLLMAEHRDRVKNVVLTACDAYDAFPPRSLRPLLVAMRAPGALWLGGQLGRFRLMRRMVTPRPVTHAGIDDATVRRWTKPLLVPGIRRDLGKVLADMHPRYTLAAADANTDFPRPVLIAWGDDDRIFPRQLAERLALDLPHARLTTIADCAAFAALDQPERLAELIHESVNTTTVTPERASSAPQQEHRPRSQAAKPQDP